MEKVTQRKNEWVTKVARWLTLYNYTDPVNGGYMVES